MRAVIIGLTSASLLAAGAARFTQAAAIDEAAVGRLVDAVMQAGMAEEKIPGAAVLVVHHGKVILERGYGVAEIASKRPIDPATTRWPFASVTKVVTATALMQLIERGRLDPNADVNRYLKIARVPPHQGPPVTARHLLTHTDALDELPGRRVESAKHRKGLAEFLKSRLVVSGRPGGVTRYGSYGIALAGVLIEDVSGMPYPEYLRREVFARLGMERTTIDPPPDAVDTVATPYERAGEGVTPARYEWYETTPTSSLVSTVRDMGRFMALHLGALAQPSSERVLGRASISDMAAPQATVHPAIPGWGFGWQQDDANGRRIVEHGGDIGGFSSLLTLLPDEGFGFVVVHHLEGSNLRFRLKRELLNRFFPERRTLTRPSSSTNDLSAYRGTWLANNYCRSCADGAQNAQRFEIALEPSGGLNVWGTTWRPIGPHLFATEDGTRRIGFMQDERGNPAALSGGSWRVLERAPPAPSSRETPPTADQERQAITNAALDYIEGWYTADTPRMQRAVHPELAKRIVTTDATGHSRLFHAGASELIANTARGGGSSMPLEARRRDMIILDIHGSAASVRIRAATWVDYLHLAKVDGRWVIVNVLWERDELAPQLAPSPSDGPDRIRPHRARSGQKNGNGARHQQ